MLKDFLKEKRGSALVFAFILIGNALAILSVVIFISSIQNRAASKMSLTPVAFQKADSGIEYLLRRINKSNEFNCAVDPNCNGKDIDDLCNSFGSNYNNGRCSVDDSVAEFDAYFLNVNGDVMGDSDNVSDIAEIKVMGTAENGLNTVSRSLKVSLFEI